MKAVVVHKYGGPEELKCEEFRDAVARAGEVLVRMAATSVNPIDLMGKSGMAKDSAPIKLAEIIVVDTASTVVDVGAGVKDFSPGERVLAMGDQTYAELCVAPTSNLVKLPADLDLVEAAALPW